MNRKISRDSLTKFAVNEKKICYFGRKWNKYKFVNVCLMVYTGFIWIWRHSWMILWKELIVLSLLWYCFPSSTECLFYWQWSNYKIIKVIKLFNICSVQAKGLKNFCDYAGIQHSFFIIKTYGVVSLSHAVERILNLHETLQYVLILKKMPPNPKWCFKYSIK